MSGFDFAFTLFGLLLGLSLTELFGGFARALRRRRSIRIGWLSPLLALVMTVDLVSHWVAAWSDREAIAVTFPMLLFGTESPAYIIWQLRSCSPMRSKNGTI
jgi:hypothetical protein